MVAVLSSVCTFSVYSSALNIASCSAWLLVHLLFNLYFRLALWSPDLNMATPAPTPCSDLLPSVNIWIALRWVMPVYKFHVAIYQSSILFAASGELVELKFLYFYSDGGQFCYYAEGFVRYRAVCLSNSYIYWSLYPYELWFVADFVYCFFPHWCFV